MNQRKTIADLILAFEQKDKLLQQIDGKLIFEGIENEDDLIEMKLYLCPEGEQDKHLKTLARQKTGKIF